MVPEKLQAQFAKSFLTYSFFQVGLVKSIRKEKQLHGLVQHFWHAARRRSILTHTVGNHVLDGSDGDRLALDDIDKDHSFGIAAAIE
jgi:hypothetical protein